MNWKTIRIFISSTFSDMHAERDHLVRFVFPELKEKCRKLHVHLIDVDLRWGVTEKDAEEGKALDICLDEIDSCRPYFIGLLGQRYGHIPSGHHHSITAQEICHGVLHNELPKQIVDLRNIIEGRFEGKWLSEEQINALVKCYDLQYSKYVLKENISSEDEKIIRSVFAQYSSYQRDRSFFFFRNESLTGQLAGNNIKDFFEESQENKDKLETLKKEIGKGSLPYFEYDSIEKFSELVRDTLWSHIEKEIGDASEVEKDWLTQEQELHELFMADRTRRFVGRRDLLKRMHTFCSGESRIAWHDLLKRMYAFCIGDSRIDDSNIIIITGEPGCGKSALMAQFTKEFMVKHPDVIVIPHFVGASPNSTSLRLVLKRLCMYIYEKCDLENQKVERLNQISANDKSTQKERNAIEKEYSISESYTELVQTFRQFLKKASAYKIVFLIDAVNQLEKSENAHSMYWLPEELNELLNVRFVISTLSGDAYGMLMRRKVKPFEEIVRRLKPSETEGLVKEYLKDVRKDNFPNENIERAFFKKVIPCTPLYILVALEELRIFPRYEEVGSRVEELPDNVPALFEQVLQRIEGDFNQELVKDLMSYIACGRYGMTAEELQTLLRDHAPRLDPQSEPQKLPDMLWARLYRAFSAYLFERSGVIDFFHGQLKEAVGIRYLKEESDRYKVHKVIVDYFETRWQDPYARALDELPHQQVKAKMWTELEKTLTTFMFLQKKIEAFGPQTLIEDYDVVLKPGSIFSDESRKSLAMICGTIVLSRNVLTNDRTSLAGQLLGRCLNCKELVIEKLLQQAKERQQAIWLRPLTQSLIPPGGPLIRTLGREIRTIEGHSGSVYSVAITPDGGRALTASADKTLKVWNLDNYREIRTLEGHSGSVYSVAITPDGGRALTASADKTLKVWNLDNYREIRTLEVHSFVTFVAIIPDSSRAVFASSATLSVWDFESGRVICTIGGHSELVTNIVITPDGRRAVTASWDETLRIWDIESGRNFRTIRGLGKKVRAVAVTPDGNQVVSGASEFKVWDIESGREMRTLKVHRFKANSVVITPDGRHAVSVSGDWSLKVWDIESGDVLSTFGSNSGMKCCAVTPDGRTIVSGDESGRMHFLRLEGLGEGEEKIESGIQNPGDSRMAEERIQDTEFRSQNREHSPKDETGGRRKKR